MFVVFIGTSNSTKQISPFPPPPAMIISSDKKKISQLFTQTRRAKIGPGSIWPTQSRLAHNQNLTRAKTELNGLAYVFVPSLFSFFRSAGTTNNYHNL